MDKVEQPEEPQNETTKVDIKEKDEEKPTIESGNESPPSTAKESTIDRNLTISTKLSTDQLICKSPRESPRPASKTTQRYGDVDSGSSSEYLSRQKNNDTLVYLALLQMLFGILMVVFGVLVLVHEASLAQLCGGIWGGCVAITAGVTALGAAARDCCPLRARLAQLALTAHLALSLVALAIANLVLVLAAIGIARDTSRPEDILFYPKQTDTNTTSNVKYNNDEEEAYFVISTWGPVLSNVGLVIACACECVAAAISAWHCARIVCPCFRNTDDDLTATSRKDMSVMAAAAAGNSKDVLVSAWLGKQPLSRPIVTPTNLTPSRRASELTIGSANMVSSAPAPIYVVTSTKRVGKKHGIIPTPVYAIPSPASLGSYTLPLPTVPTGYLMPPHVHRRPHKLKYPPGSYERVQRRRKRYPSDQQLRSTLPDKIERKRDKRRREKKIITEADVVRTYTGLDRVIAEDFIVHCDASRNMHSLCSKSDESSGSGADTSLSSEIASREKYMERL